MFIFTPEANEMQRLCQVNENNFFFFVHVTFFLTWEFKATFEKSTVKSVELEDKFLSSLKKLYH